MTVYDLEHVELAYAPPYGSAKDPVNMIGFLASNLLRGDIDLWYAEDYPDCAERVRSSTCAPWPSTTPGTSPRRSSFPTPSCEPGSTRCRETPVYTYCRSGFRSYIAYCMLKQHGWDDAAFLSGGMITYHGFHRTPLEVGKGGMPDRGPRRGRDGQRAGALEHV